MLAVFVGFMKQLCSGNLWQQIHGSKWCSRSKGYDHQAPGKVRLGSVPHIQGYPVTPQDQPDAWQQATGSGRRIFYHRRCMAWLALCRSKKLYSAACAAAGIPAIISAGIYPGTSNVMAAHILSLARKEYDEDMNYQTPPEGG